MHYRILAITATGSDRELEEAMAPYDENLELEPYVSETKAEYLARNREWAAKLSASLSRLDSDPAKREEAMARNRGYFGWLTSDDGGRRIAALAPLDAESAYAAFRARDEADGIRFDADGNRLSTYNHQAKYDYYGTFAGLPLRGGGEAADAPSEEIDWERIFLLDPEERLAAEEFWRRHVLGEPYPGMTIEESREKVAEKYGPLIYKPEWYLIAYGDLKGYLASVGFRTYAVLDGIGGQWHAPGNMGWFASSESPEEWGAWGRGYPDLVKGILRPGCHVWLLDLHI